MSYKKIFINCFLLIGLCGSLFARQRGGTLPRVNSGTGSQVTVTSGCKLKNSSSAMNVGKAKINVKTGAVAEGLPIGFIEGGVALNNGSATTFTGNYYPTTGTVSVANSSWRGQSGSIEANVQLSDGASMEGIPNVNNPVTVASGATANLGVQSTVNSNINIDGASANLSNDLNFGENSQFEGDGTIFGNGNSAILGGRDLIITSSVKWVNSDVVVNSRITMYGQWTFLSDIHILGRGNLIDLTHGGRIIIKNNTTVYLANINVKGLTASKLIFEGANSKVVLSSASLEFDSNYTLTIGQVYVDSPSTMIVGDKILTFAGSSYLTVNGVSLFYDVLQFPDQNNIKPIPSQDPTQTYIKYVNNGVIRSYSSLGGAGDMHFYTNIYLGDLLVLKPSKRAFFDESLLFDGNQNVLYFASKGSDPVAFIADGKTVSFMDIKLQDYSNDLVSFGSDSKLVLGDQVIVNMGKNDYLNTRLTFTGNCVLNGNGQELELGPSAEILIDEAGSTLLLNDIKLKGVSTGKIRCANDTCTLRIKNVDWVQDNTFTFSVGRFDVVGLWNLSGQALFDYQSGVQSLINTNGMMFFDSGMTLGYNPPIDDNQLILMTDATSAMYLNGMTIASTTTGLQLINGLLFVDGKNYVNNSATSVSEGFILGDGNPVDNVNISMIPGASLNVSGCMDYQNN